MSTTPRMDFPRRVKTTGYLLLATQTQNIIYYLFVSLVIHSDRRRYMRKNKYPDDYHNKLSHYYCYYDAQYNLHYVSDFIAKCIVSVRPRAVSAPFTDKCTQKICEMIFGFIFGINQQSNGWIESVNQVPTNRFERE